MKRLGIIAVWLVVLVIDGVILPALLGWVSGFGIMVFLSALAITFGIHRWVIGSGILFAGITELILGASFGTLIGAWLAMAGGWYVVNRFLSMRPLDDNDSWFSLVLFVMLGFGLFALGESALWLITRVTYESGLAATTLSDIVYTPKVIMAVLSEIILTLLVFRYFYLPRNSIYG